MAGGLLEAVLRRESIQEVGPAERAQSRVRWIALAEERLAGTKRRSRRPLDGRARARGARAVGKGITPCTESRHTCACPRENHKRGARWRLRCESKTVSPKNTSRTIP